MNKKISKARDKEHLKKYEEKVSSIYDDINKRFENYALSFKKNEDKMIAEFHCLYNFFVYGFARLKMISQKKENEELVYFDFLNKVFEKGSSMGGDNIKINRDF